MSRRTKKLLLVTAAVLACGGSSEYANNDLELAASHAAHDLCSCLFVMNMPEDYCRAWVKASPEVARFPTDPQKKTVAASARIRWGARARHEGAHHGCTLE